MKVQKQLSRKVNGKKYPKYVIVISPSTIEKLGWKEGQTLEEQVQDRELLLKPIET